MFGLSTSHIIILAIIALLFGSKRLPELGSSLGKAIGAFKANSEGRDSKKEENV
jgi:sec-independent protein translocase protein TatA